MSARTRFILVIMAMAAALGTVWLLAVAPKRAEAARLGAQLRQAVARGDETRARAASAPTAEQARATYGRDYATVARLGKAVPPTADVASLVYQLESAARAARVDFRSVSVEDAPTTAPASATSQAPAATGDVQPKPFTFAFEGAFSGLRRLLAAIDRFSRVSDGTLSVSGRLLTIDSVVMTAGRGGLPQVKADIVAKAYVAELPTELPPGDSGTDASQEEAP